MGEFLEKWWPTLLGVVLVLGAGVLLWPDQKGPNVALGPEPSAAAALGPPNPAPPTRTDQEVERQHNLEDARRHAMLREAEDARERSGDAAADADSEREPTSAAADAPARTIRLTENSPEVQRALRQVEVELYETSWCKYCKKTRAFLDRSGVNYRAYDIEADGSAKVRKDQLSPAKGVPLTVVDGQIISGYSESELNSAFQTAVGQRLSAR